MVDNKPNDWMLLKMDNPNFSLSRFKDVGITPDNTSLQSREFYKNNNYIRLQFSDPNTGKFDEVKFNSLYNEAATSYNLFALNQYEDDIYADLTFDPLDNMRPVGSRVKTPEIKIEKISNPWRKKLEISRLGWIDNPEKSDLELASASKVFNFDTKKYEDYTADDMSLFSNPINFLKSIVDPLVLATWDEDGYHTDPISGKLVYHKKGDNKTNEDGDFYFETLGNRNPYGKKVKSAFDSLTAESSSLNKYDFFDSDDLDKSVMGTVFKTAAQIAPLFTPIAPYYGAAMVGKEMLNLFPMVYNSTIGNFAKTPEFLNKLSGVSSVLSSTISDYSTKNMLSFENLMNIVTDVALLQLQQRTIFNWMNHLSGNAKRMKDMEKDMKNFFEFLDAVKKGNQTASSAALAYMAMTQGLDTYNEGILLGLSKPEAALTAWGAMIGMYKIDKIGIGEIFFPELEAGLAAAREAAKQVSRRFADAFDKTVIKAPKSKNKLVNLFNSALNKSYKHWSVNDNITGFWDAVKTHSLTFMGKTIGEGLEEVAEEAVTDLAKSTFNLYSYVLGRKNEKGEQLSFDILDTAPERYGMNFLGGAIGGAIFGTKMIVTGENLSGLTKQELTYLIRNGLTQEVLKQLDDLRDKGKLGNKNIRGKYDIIENETVDDNGNKQITYDKVWQSALSKEESLNWLVWEATRAYILALDKAIHQSGFNMSDADVMEKFVAGDFRLQLLLENDIIRNGFEHEILNEFQNMTTEYTDLVSKQVRLTDKLLRQLEKALKSGININSENISEKEKSELQKLGISEDDRQAIKDIEDTNKRILELEKKRDEFFSGQYAVDFLDRMLALMDVAVMSSFYAPTFELFVKLRTGKELSEFSQEQLKGLEEAYKEYKDESNKNNIAKIAYDILKALNIQFAPDINSLEEKLKTMLKLSEYIRSTLFSMKATFGELISEDDVKLGKYQVIPIEKFRIADRDGELLEHIDSVNKVLEGTIEYLEDEDTWRIFSYGKGSGLVINRDLIIVPELSELQKFEDLAKIDADESLDAEDKIAMIAARLKYWDWVSEHNKLAFEKLREIIEKVKEFGVIDSETKSVLSNIFYNLISPSILKLIDVSKIKSNISDLFTGNVEVYNFDFDNLISELALSKFVSDIVYNSKFDNFEQEFNELLKGKFKRKLTKDLFKSIFDKVNDLILKLLDEVKNETNPENKKKLLKQLSQARQTKAILHPLNDDIDLVSDLQLLFIVNSKLSKPVLTWLDNNLTLQVTDEDIKSIYNVIGKEIKTNIENLNDFDIYKTLHSELTQLESPLYDFVSKLSVAIYGEKLSIFDFFKNLDDLILAAESIQEYVLSKNATDELDQAKKVLDIVASLIYASLNSKIDADNVFGHNLVVIEFAKEHGLKTDYETLPIDLATAMLKELDLWKSRLDFISDLNDANSINLFKEHTKTEKKAVKLLIDAFKGKAEFEFLKKLTVKIDDKEYGLLDGIDNLNINITENSDLSEIRKALDQVLILVYTNFLKMLELSKLNSNDLAYELFKNITELCPAIVKQETSRLNSKIQNITEYDACLLLLSSAVLSKLEFDFLLNESLLSSEGIAPLFAQLWNIFLGSALVRDHQAFNGFLKALNKSEFNNAVNILDNLVFIDGIGGSGKTKVVANLIYKIAKKVNPDIKVVRSGPTNKQLENLSEAIPEGLNMLVEDLVKLCIGEAAFKELKLELDLPYSRKKEYKYLKNVLFTTTSGLKTSLFVLNMDSIKILDLDWDIVFLDEVSFVNSIYLKILTQAASKNGFLLICTGDYNQQYIEPTIGGIANIERPVNIAIRAPQLRISMRVQNTLKNDNLYPILTTLENTLNTEVSLLRLLTDVKSILFKYYEYPSGKVNGDKLTKSLSKEELKSIIEDSENLAYIFDSANSQTKKNLDLVLIENPELKSKVTILTKEEVQGSEYDQVIIDLNYNPDPGKDEIEQRLNLFSVLSTVYTMSTRGKNGSIFIENDLTNLFSPTLFAEQFRTDTTKDTKEIIKSFREEYFLYLKDVLEGYTPPKYKEPTKSEEAEESDKKDDTVIDKTVDETFEDVIDDKGKLKLPDDEKVDPSDEEIKVSLNLLNIRSYCFYTRIGCRQNDSKKYVRTENDYSDLNAILDVEGKDTSTSESVSRFKFIKSLVSTGKISNESILKAVKKDVMFSAFDKSFIDSAKNGEYYIEGRKTDSDLDKPDGLKDFDLAKFGDESINIVYKFTHNGKTYSITASRLADPDTWITYLKSKSAPTSEADKYKKLYNEIIEDIRKGKVVTRQLDKSKLQFLTSARLVKTFDEDNKVISYDGGKLSQEFPDNLHSERLFIYANADEGFLNTKLKGTRAISLLCPEYSFALNEKGEYERVTRKNMYRLYEVAKNAIKDGKPYDCPIRAVVMTSKPQYIFNGTGEFQNVSGFFNINIRELKHKYGDKWRLAFDTHSSYNTMGKIVLSLWESLVELHKIKCYIASGLSLATINTNLQNMLSKFRYTPDTTDNSVHITEKGAIGLNKVGLDNYHNILKTLFLQISGFIQLPNEMEIFDLENEESEKKLKYLALKGADLIAGHLVTGSKKKLEFILSDGKDEEVVKLDSTNLKSFLPLFFNLFFRRVIGVRRDDTTDDTELEDIVEHKKIPRDTLVLYDDGSFSKLPKKEELEKNNKKYIKLANIESIAKAIGEFAEVEQVKPHLIARSVFNTLIHGLADPYNNIGAKVTITKSDGRSVIPFPMGIFFRPVYEHSKKDGSDPDGLHFYKAINEYDKFTLDVVVEPGMIYFSTDAVGEKTNKPEVTIVEGVTKYKAGDKINIYSETGAYSNTITITEVVEITSGGKSQYSYHIKYDDGRKGTFPVKRVDNNPEKYKLAENDLTEYEQVIPIIQGIGKPASSKINIKRGMLFINTCIEDKNFLELLIKTPDNKAKDCIISSLEVNGKINYITLSKLNDFDTETVSEVEYSSEDGLFYVTFNDNRKVAYDTDGKFINTDTSELDNQTFKLDEDERKVLEVLGIDFNIVESLLQKDNLTDEETALLSEYNGKLVAYLSDLIAKEANALFVGGEGLTEEENKYKSIVDKMITNKRINKSC